MNRPTWLAMSIVAVAALTGCAGAAGPTASPTLGPAAVTVEARGGFTANVAFSTKSIEIKSGDVVRLVNVGDVQHDFTIDVGGTVPETPADQHIALQIPVDLLNKTNQAAITLPPGTYQYYCSIDLGSGAGHANNGMFGTITVH